MSAGQNHSNFALNTRLSAPRYDTWCKIQVIQRMKNGVFEMNGIQTGYQF
jgi:hypothetical protein